jgi:hypothetical protein
MKIVFILVLCLSQALCDPFVLLASKISALKNPEDEFVGVVKGQHQSTSTETTTTKSEPEAEHPADKVETTKEVVHSTTTTDQIPPPPPPQQQPQAQPLAVTTSSTQKTDTTQTTPTTTTDQTTTTTTTTAATAKKDELELSGNGDTTVAKPAAEKEAEKAKEETVVVKEDTTTTKTSTDADVLEKLKNLKERVEKLENEETQKADYGKSSTTSTTPIGAPPANSNYVSTANGPVPKVYDGNGVPHPGQIIGVSQFGVATPLIGVGAADPSNKQKYNSVDVGKALNTDTKAISEGKGVAEQADQAHKDFLDENTEEFERIMSWLQEQQQLLPKQHQPPKLLFQILKERIMIQEQKVLSQMLEKQQVSQPKQQPEQPPPQQQLL